MSCSLNNYRSRHLDHDKCVFVCVNCEVKSVVAIVIQFET